MFASLALNAVLAIASSTGMVGDAVAAMPATASPVPVETSLPTPQFRRFGIANGLPGGQVYAAVQDRNGLMWFGSAGGLVRYDGIDFHVFRHAMDDPESLPFNTIYSLLADRKGRIWAGGIFGGLQVYDPSSGRFRHWEHQADDPHSLSSNEVWDIAQTADGALWVATQDGLDRMRADEKGFDRVALSADGAAASSFGTVRALLAEADGRLWIGAESGMYLRLADGQMQSVPVDPAYTGDVHNIWSIDGGDGEVRIAAGEALLVIGADGMARPLLQKSTSRVVSSARDAHGRLWIGKTDELVLDADKEHQQSIQGHPLLPGGLPGSKIWQTMIDGEGGLWITFEESSIAYLPPGWDGFTRFTHVPDDPDSLSNVTAAALLIARDGRLWVGGDDGWLDKLDVHTGQVEHVFKGMRSQIVSMTEDARSRLWLAVPGGLKLYERGKLRSIDLGQGPLTRPVLLAAADDDKIYVASWGEGVFVIDPDTLKITSVPMAGDPGDGARLPSQLVYRKGKIWYASAAGLMRLDDVNGTLAFVAGVALGDVRAFDFDADGFWVLTQRTMEHYRHVDGKAEQDDAVDASPARSAGDLLALRVDRQGAIWLFANPGLWRFDPSMHKFTSFGAAQGLPNAEFGSGDTRMTADGMILASDTGGVVAFQPQRLLHRAPATDRAPPLTLTSLRIRREGMHQQLALHNGRVRLGWRDRDLQVGARLASYVDPPGNRYRYRLSGFDNEWVDVGSRGEREFAGLTAGDYQLDVRAAGTDGRWSGLSEPLHIHVQAPPWMRWWAWLGYVVVLLAVVGLILRSWRKRLAQRHQMQLVEQQRQMAEAASAAKTQFLATLSHEIRTPMTGVMGMAELLMSTPLSPLQHDYTQAMQRSGNMLLKLLNDALDLARIEAGRLELEPVAFDPRQLLTEVAQLEQGLAQTKGLRFDLEMADDLPTQVLGDALRIQQILLNLANNALKFTEHGSVTLCAQRYDKGLQFSIRDTGPGIPEASQARLFQRFEQEEGPQRRAGSGLGLAICRELVDMMHGSIELESRLGHGTTFRVRLPLAEPEASMPRASGATTNRTWQLLLVEDDMIVAAVIRGLLERQGHTVVHVANGLAALSELAHAAFDAVLLDLDLPGVDGFQVARLIRQRESGSQHLPILAVTARSGSEAEANARAAGMDGFLRKPLRGEQLAVALARLISDTPTAAG